MIKLVGLFLALAMLLTPVPVKGENYDVTLPYDPVEGCSWVYRASREDVVACERTETKPHLWQEGRETVTFTFRGLQSGTTDLTFRYAPGGEWGAEARDAWLIRLHVDERGNVNEEPAGVYETRYHSFDGGGPEYTVELSDDQTVHAYSYVEYANPDHNLMDGSAFDEVWVFSGRKPGKTEVIVTMNLYGERTTTDHFELTVDEDLTVKCERGKWLPPLLSLEFMRGGYNAPVTFCLTRYGDSGEIAAQIEGTGVNFDGIVGEDIWEKAEEIVRKYDLASWDGFSGYEPEILDGEGFALYLVFEDGFSCSASGDNCFPADYFVVSSEMDGLMEIILDQYGPEA